MNSASAVKTHNTAKDKRFKMLDATIKRYQYQQDALIEILHKAQSAPNPVFSTLRYFRDEYLALIRETAIST